MDNVFVFAVVFGFFQVPKKYQYRVLFWGILGAIVMRLSFVLAGAGLLSRFDWLMYVFGAFLIFTAIKLSLHSGEDVHPDRNIVLRLARRVLPVAQGDHGDRGVGRGQLHQFLTVGHVEQIGRAGIAQRIVGAGVVILKRADHRNVAADAD